MRRQLSVEYLTVPKPFAVVLEVILVHHSVLAVGRLRFGIGQVWDVIISVLCVSKFFHSSLSFLRICPLLLVIIIPLVNVVYKNVGEIEG